MRRQAELLGDHREAKLLRPLWTFDAPHFAVISIAPLSGCTIPISDFISVLFPAPFSPQTP